MRNKYRLVLVFLIILQVFTSCMKTARFHELKLCGSYAVPGMFHGDLKAGCSAAKVLEEDTQGRLLFEYTATNVITGEEETALVICQQIDDSYVYFYEDQCYVLGDYDVSDVAMLKSKNDWGCALDETRMSRRSNKISFDLYINIDTNVRDRDSRNSIVLELGITDSQVKELSILDISPKGQVFYFACVIIKDAEQKYLAIVGSSYDTAILEISDHLIMPEEIAAFKQANGWQFN